MKLKIAMLFFLYLINCSTGRNVKKKNSNAPSKFIYNLPSYFLATKDRFSHMGTVSITIVAINQITIKEISAKLNKINKKINKILKNKSYSELDSTDDLKNISIEIKYEINSLLIKGKIDRVIFNEFILN